MTSSPSRPRARRQLPFQDWPRNDRQAWTTLLVPGDALTEGGAAVGWAPNTLEQRRRAYAYWLCYLEGTGGLTPDLPPADRVTPESVRGYLESLAGLGGNTVAMYLTNLHGVLQAMAPERDWRWLRRVRDRILRTAEPRRPKSSRLQASSKLFAAGLAVMQEAEATDTAASSGQASGYRNGLIIALLAARPLRLHNLAMITIGRHLLASGDGYQLCFEAAETKTRQPLELPWPTALVPALERYLRIHRPILLQGQHSDRLWIGCTGVPLTCSALYELIIRTTRTRFGTSINPHLFRDAAATSIAIEDPEHVRIAAALLGHATLRTTERYYNQAGMLDAGRQHQKNLLALRRTLPSSTAE